MNEQLKDEFVNKLNDLSKEFTLKKSSYGHYFVVPMPKEDELSKFYQNKYFNNATLVESKGMDIGSSDKKERFYHNRQYNEITSFMDKIFFNKDIDILDVGCGTGAFLSYLFNNGYKNVFGTEYDSSLNNPNIEIFNGSFLDFNTDKKFDFITFNNVLEHVINPLEFLQKAYNLLKDGGYIRVQVPNDFSYSQYRALISMENPNFYFFCPPEHLHYFDFGSMEKLLNDVGFKVIEKTTNWSMDLFILMGLDYSADKMIGKQCHNYRVNFEYNMGEEALTQFYSKMAELELGRVVIEYAKKI